MNYGSLVIVKSTQYNNLAPMLYGQVSGQITIMGFPHACRGAIGLKAFSFLFFVKIEKKYLVPVTLNCLVNSRIVGRALIYVLLACSSSPSMKSLVSCPAVALLNSTSSGLGTLKNKNSIFWLKL